MTFAQLKSIPKPNNTTSSQSMWISLVARTLKTSELGVISAINSIGFTAIDQIYTDTKSFDTFVRLLSKFPNYKENIKLWCIFRGKTEEDLSNIKQGLAKSRNVNTDSIPDKVLFEYISNLPKN
jgi:hypothetical protein